MFVTRPPHWWLQSINYWNELQFHSYSNWSHISLTLNPEYSNIRHQVLIEILLLLRFYTIIQSGWPALITYTGQYHGQSISTMLGARASITTNHPESNKNVEIITTTNSPCEILRLTVPWCSPHSCLGFVFFGCHLTKPSHHFLLLQVKCLFFYQK